MHHRNRLLVLLFVLNFLAAATLLEKLWASGFSEVDRKKANDLYLTKCTKCHKLYDPKSYNDEQWDGWMKKMKKKAHLSGEQDALIRQYLDSLRSQ